MFTNSTTTSEPNTFVLMHSVEAITTAVSAVSLAASITAALPCFWQIRSLAKRSQREGQIRLAGAYSDKDGDATEESEASYNVKIQKALILIASINGCADAIVLGVRSILRMEYSFIIGWWLFAGAWLFILASSMYLLLERAHLNVYACAIRLIIVSTLLSLALLTQVVFWAQAQDLFPILDFGLICGQLGSAVVIFLSAFVIPRRPDVYNNGRPVESMGSLSIASWMFFTSMNQILDKAWKTGHLDDGDLHRLGHSQRTQELMDSFYALPKQAKLWIGIVKANKKYFSLQWTIQVIVSVLQFLPQYFLLQILKALEERHAGGTRKDMAWMFVVGLFVATISTSILNNLLMWFSMGKLGVDIRSQLNALVFDKSLRKKDVKGTQKKNEKLKLNDINEEVSEVPGPTDDLKKIAGDDDEEEDALKGMKQGVINLIAVDAPRIVIFASWNVIFLETFFSLSIGLFFLYTILGWQSLIAGLAVNIALLPLNTYVAKAYQDAQDKVMKVRDKKMAVISEALQGIRQIKFAALEEQWCSKIEKVRGEELKQIFRVCATNCGLISIWIIGPIFLSVISLSTYAILHGELKPSVAFTALAIFNELEFAMSVVPELLGDLLDALISSKRIQDYLDSPDKAPTLVKSNKIAFRNASIAWAADNEAEEDRFVLRDLNIEFPMNELSIISGATGSGKSLMLSALLGEADVLSGTIEMPEAPKRSERFDSKANLDNWILPTAMAYVAQIPWIENATIKANVLFGLPYIESRYKRVLKACALQKDMLILEDGDQTEIGANGINLSGGQKWRVSLARAVYSRAGIIILDDIFSAVDAHVGRQLFVSITGDLMKDRTRILVTHHVSLCLSRAKYTVCLANNRVEHAGDVAELKRTGSLAKIMAIVEQETGQEDDETIISEDGSSSTAMTTPLNELENTVKVAKVFVQEETREEGAVKRTIYKEYLTASGGVPVWTITLAVFLLNEISVLARTWWLKMWTGSYETESIPPSVILHIASFHRNVQVQTFPMPDSEPRSLEFWIGTYFAVSASVVIFATFKYGILYAAALRASRLTFNKMTNVVLRTPLRWLDTVPVGRILNRFSADFAKFDIVLAEHLGFFGYNAFQLIAVVCAGVFISPYLITFSLVLLALSGLVALYYLKSARELKRMESNTKSPILELYGSVLLGVATIRSFGKVEEYIDKMFAKMDTLSEITFFLYLANRWMGIRLGFIGAAFSCTVALVIVAMPNVDASLAGFALTFAMEYSMTCVWCLRRYADLELDMNSAERIIEYTLLPTEDESGTLPPASWPHEGNLKFDNLVVSYDAGLPPVLKGLTFEVKPRERVGVVGRTGAGKSSLTLALFRFLKASEGTIHIDGLDISKIPLHEVRSRLAIIPQDPVLFSGTLRSNLDTFNQHTDAELLDALARVHMMDGEMKLTLDSSVAEGGLNLSQGQRQLLCLARAIVSRPRIMVLDEATSAVDMSTDTLIQKSVREEFSDCTLLVIAHRLQTIIDYDRILVLDDGKVLEYGTPHELIEKKSAFYEMVMQTGDADGLIEAAKLASSS